MPEEIQPQHRSWEKVMQLWKLLVSAIEPVAELIKAISRLR